MLGNLVTNLRRRQGVKEIEVRKKHEWRQNSELEARASINEELLDLKSKIFKLTL